MTRVSVFFASRKQFSTVLWPPIVEKTEESERTERLQVIQDDPVYNITESLMNCNLFFFYCLSRLKRLDASLMFSSASLKKQDQEQRAVQHSKSLVHSTRP